MEELLRQNKSLARNQPLSSSAPTSGRLQIIADNARTPTDQSTPASPLLEKMMLARGWSSSSSKRSLETNSTCSHSTTATTATEENMMSVSPSSTILSHEFQDDDDEVSNEGESNGDSSVPSKCGIPPFVLSHHDDGGPCAPGGDTMEGASSTSNRKQNNSKSSYTTSTATATKFVRARGDRFPLSSPTIMKRNDCKKNRWKPLTTPLPSILARGAMQLPRRQHSGEFLSFHDGTTTKNQKPSSCSNIKRTCSNEDEDIHGCTIGRLLCKIENKEC
jgi:hypothetical protein